MASSRRLSLDSGPYLLRVALLLSGDLNHAEDLVQGRVVVLRHLLDLSESETARELAITIGTVKSHNARALAPVAPAAHGKAAVMAAPRDALTDDAIVAYLRTRAPGLPAISVDAPAITARARRALRRRRRRQIRTSIGATTSAAAAYLALALLGPVSVPGVGPVSVPGGNGLRAVVGKIVPGLPSAPDQWLSDVDRLQQYVLPVVQRLQISSYLLEPGPPCRVLEYPVATTATDRRNAMT